MLLCHHLYANEGGQKNGDGEALCMALCMALGPDSDSNGKAKKDSGRSREEELGKEQSERDKLAKEDALSAHLAEVAAPGRRATSRIAAVVCV